MLKTQEITDIVWREKYRSNESERAIGNTHERVCKGVYINDMDGHHFLEALVAMKTLEWCPAGRIHAGAGTGRKVTLINCYVSPTIEDSIVTESGEPNTMGIMQALEVASLTQQMGGGIGMDFSTLRPKGALVRKRSTASSGPITFMDLWNTMCGTIMAAGNRRGAMMATLACDHPDVLEFIEAKHTPGRLTNFNISILISDKFMRAVNEDTLWLLGFNKPRLDKQHVGEVTQENGEIWYVYHKLPARELWEKIIRSTYDYAEPGVIFIDRINQWNNLWYCEEIRATNPCFTGDTLITTRRGLFPIQDLVGKEVEVWDGNDWTVINNFRVTEYDHSIIKIELQDGSTVCVTPYHKMVLENGEVIEAKDLILGQKLMLSLLESHGYHDEPGAYAKGFFLGDGSEARRGRPWLAIYENSGKEICKERIISSLKELEPGPTNTNSITELGWREGDYTGRQHRDTLSGLAPLKNHLLPWLRCRTEGLPTEVFSWSLKSKAEFLAGLFDADGTILDSDHAYGYQLSASGYQLLLDIQMLLKTFGVRSRVKLNNKKPGWKRFPEGVERWCQGSHRLTISQEGAIVISTTVKFTRLKDFSNREIVYNVKPRMGKIISIRDAEIADEVFCCTISTTHQLQIGVGILSGQCGEQPLPPHGACDLGAINLAVMVERPFTEDASLKLARIGEVAKIAMRFLDNVLDETHYPISEQHMESMNKRRTGLGITGLGNMLQQLRIRYGSKDATQITRIVMKKIRDSAYLASIDLAIERGPFPLFDADKYMKGNFIKTLPENIRKKIFNHGIRNGVLLTIAPTGTTSIYYNNISSGLEPTFAWRYKRKMRQADGSFKEFEQVEDYGYRLYKEVHGIEDDEEIMRIGLPDHMVTTQDLTVQDHLNMQAACQEFIDASISKTINCPKDITYEDFKNVYTTAYDMNLKGCTTYRPSEIQEKVRGSILSVDTPKDKTQILTIVKRPEELTGRTYKTKWQEHAYYITINEYVDADGNSRPFEVFINTKDASHQEWIMALTRSISAIFRRGGDFMFIIKELQEVHSSIGGAWVGKKYVPSLVALIGSVLEDHLTKYHSSILGLSHLEGETLKVLDDTAESPVISETCPKCLVPTLISKEGCKLCLSCGFSTCG